MGFIGREMGMNFFFFKNVGGIEGDGEGLN